MSMNKGKNVFKKKQKNRGGLGSKGLTREAAWKVM